MNKDELYELTIFISCALVCFLIGIVTTVTVINIDIEDGNESICSKEYKIIKRINKDIVRDIAREQLKRNEFVPGRYDCTEFSDNLVKSLESIGIESHSVCGYIDQNGIYNVLKEKCEGKKLIKEYSNIDVNMYHRWVYITEQDRYIESTSANDIDNELIRMYT